MESSRPTFTAPFNELLHYADDLARREPTKVIVSALGLGFLLHRLPLRALAAALIRLVFALMLPALTALGVIKAREFFSTNNAARHE